MTRLRHRTLRIQTVGISIAGVLAVTAYAVLAAMQILVWTPLAAAPGLTLEQIRGELSGAGESMNEGMTIAIVGVGVVLALALGVIAVTARAAPMIAAAGFLSLLMFGAPGFFVASFGPGMALADTFMISAGVHLPGVRVFYAISALAALLLAMGGIVAVIRARSAPAPA
ncbi:hypothetical protein [Microbacterium sp. MYb62]|uniref:hypothetical protein n=1 Tax=Microbacterium sp. MYb62 TaxID=1848690 RepID=UPI000CFD0924|nr:hypothetical protein [Microbacterium sp. MYb62]PRB12514.1 hypothetical protein CQ042_14915 [Microbacterium sp. MYb62]